MEDLGPTHLWRQHGHSSSLSMKSIRAGVGEREWQLAPRGILGEHGAKGLFVAHSWEPHPAPIIGQTPDRGFSIMSCKGCQVILKSNFITS